MSTVYWGQVWSWSLLCVCVCISVGAVWVCDQSRHRCCDLGPSSALRHGGKVYINDTPTRLVHMRVLLSICVCASVSVSHEYECLCVCCSHMYWGSGVFVSLCVRRTLCIAPVSPWAVTKTLLHYRFLPPWGDISCFLLSDISALQNADVLWNISSWFLKTISAFSTSNAITLHT